MADCQISLVPVCLRQSLHGEPWLCSQDKVALPGIPTMLTANHTRERRLTSLACHLGASISKGNEEQAR